MSFVVQSGVTAGGNRCGVELFISGWGRLSTRAVEFGVLIYFTPYVLNLHLRPEAGWDNRFLNTHYQWEVIKGA